MGMACSWVPMVRTSVKLHVTKKKLMRKTKKPIIAPNLVKLADVVSLGKAPTRALDCILTIDVATSGELD